MEPLKTKLPILHIINIYILWMPFYFESETRVYSVHKNWWYLILHLILKERFLIKASYKSLFKHKSTLGPTSSGQNMILWSTYKIPFRNQFIRVISFGYHNRYISIWQFVFFSHYTSFHIQNKILNNIEFENYIAHAKIAIVKYFKSEQIYTLIDNKLIMVLKYQFNFWFGGFS